MTIGSTVRTRIDADRCPACGGSWLVVERRSADGTWREGGGSCLRRCESAGTVDLREAVDA